MSHSHSTGFVMDNLIYIIEYDDNDVDTTLCKSFFVITFNSKKGVTRLLFNFHMNFYGSADYNRLIISL